MGLLSSSYHLNNEKELMVAIRSTQIQTGPTGKSGPVFSKLFQLDQTDPLSFGPKFAEILFEWIAHDVSNIIFSTQYPLTASREEVVRIYKMVNKGKMF